MSEEYPRRGRNWLTAMGVLFLVIATVTLVRDIIIWSPDFVVEFFFDSEINAYHIWYQSQNHELQVLPLILINLGQILCLI